MTRGVYTAASAMLVQETAQAVIANNLANANTPGYKADVATFQSFRLGALSRGGPGPSASGDLGGGASLHAIGPDLSPGAMRRTDNPLDVALKDARQFFVLRTPQGDRLSRAGEFTLAADGTLTDTGGFPVVGRDGRTIRIAPAAAPSPAIDRQGNLVSGDSVLARLQVVALDPASAAMPVKQGNRLLRAENPAALRPVDQPDLATQSLEMSNVSIVEEMVAMIGAMRAYEAAQKAVQSHDQALGQAVNEVARRA
jgi:flagellar basal-body rod protein FlgG